MNKLVIIPARGGSKGLPNKNILLLNNKPLIYYTLEVARQLFEDKYIYVSTDSLKIKHLVEKTGLKVPFIRPKSLASDVSGMHEVLIHALNHFSSFNKEKIDVIILLQPTSPLRTVDHVKSAIKIYNKNLDMVVSVKKTDSNPYYNLFEEDENNFLKKIIDSDFVTRQNCPEVWEYNGAIYIINVSSLKKQKLHKMKKIKKYKMDKLSSVDIDDNFDFKFSEYLLNENCKDNSKN